MGRAILSEQHRHIPYMAVLLLKAGPDHNYDTI
jgi:hypothetical protein